MKTKITLAFLILALTACAPAQSAPAISNTDIRNTAVAIVQANAALTQIALPTAMPPTPISAALQKPREFTLPTTAPRPTARATSTSLPAVLPKFLLDEYVMLFIKDGDLYFQDGNNSPVNLFRVGKPTNDSYYDLSDDNRLALSSGGVLNTDGTPQRETTPPPYSELERQLWGTEFGNVHFVPGTHKLISRSYLCNSFDRPTSCVSSLYLTNTDTGEFKKLADLGFSGGPQNETYKTSPNGKMVAISTTTSVDIINMDGEYIRHDILFYKPNTPNILFPSVFWLPDSSGLIVGIPSTLFDSVAYNYVPAYTIWRYTIDNNVAIQIPLTPPPMAFGDAWGEVQVSPDGKWIVYGGLGYNPEIYLGNLSNGQVQTVGVAVQTRFSWAPDSKHFIATSAGSVLGAIDSPTLMPIGNVGGWLDGKHFIWFTQRDGILKTFIAEIVPGGLKIYDPGIEEDVTILLLRAK